MKDYKLYIAILHDDTLFLGFLGFLVFLDTGSLGYEVLSTTYSIAHSRGSHQELETKISCARSLADCICTVSPLRQLEERLQVLLWLSLNAGDLPWFLRELLAQVQSALRQLPQEQTATERLGQRCDELLAETAQLLSNVEQYATFGESVVAGTAKFVGFSRISSLGLDPRAMFQCFFAISTCCKWLGCTHSIDTIRPRGTLD